MRNSSFSRRSQESAQEAAALDKTLSAELSIEELEIMKRIYRMQVNLNQLAKLANTCGLPFTIDAIREYIVRTNEYFRTGVWREMDLTNYEAEQKQRDKLADKVKDLQECNDNLMKVSSTYYFYTAEGERLFCERYKCPWQSGTITSTNRHWLTPLWTALRQMPFGWN